MKTFILTVS